MCGEMAGDPRYTRLLLGLGLTEFSMHPSSVLEVKSVVRESSVGELRGRVGGLLERIMSGETGADPLEELLRPAS